MKVIVAGSRTITDRELVLQAIADSKFTITEVISGGAKGVDRIAEEWAKEQGIPVTVIRTGWKTGGRGGGFVNNEEMADQAEALIAVYDGQSKGTKHMIDTMRKKGRRFLLKCGAPKHSDTRGDCSTSRSTKTCHRKKWLVLLLQNPGTSNLKGPIVWTNLSARV